MSQADDLERLRIAQGDRSPTSDPGVEPGTRLVARVTSTSPVVGKFLNAVPQLVLGTPAEGQVGAFSDLGAAIPVLLLGPEVPATNDRILVRAVNNRWVARRRSTTPVGGQFVCGGCTVPPVTLAMNFTYYTSPTTFAGPAFVALDYQPSGLEPTVPGFWISGDLDAPADSQYAQQVPQAKMRFTISCYGANFSILQELFRGDGGVFFGSYSEPGIGSGTTCTPFYLELIEAGCCIGFFHSGSVVL